MTVALEEFRREVRAWLEENCPEPMRTPMPQDEMASGGKRARYKNPDTKRWMDLCAGKGFTAPTWPVEYGGAGMGSSQQQVFRQEMARINAHQPLLGMGLSMIGPALLEFGTDEQKAEHLLKVT